MKKKVIVLLLVVCMVLSMVGCGNTRNDPIDTTSTDGSESYNLEFQAKGHYNMQGFGDEYYIYRFANPNANIVVYQLSDSLYILGEDAGETGTSYASIFMEGSQFIALSDKYMLFSSGNEITAVAIEKKENVEIGESILQKCSFNELTEDEKSSFVYPISHEKIAL